MAYRVTLTIAMYSWAAEDPDNIFLSKGKMIISMSAAFLNLLAIVILNKVCKCLTEVIKAIRL